MKLILISNPGFDVALLYCQCPGKRAGSWLRYSNGRGAVMQLLQPYSLSSLGLAESQSSCSHVAERRLGVGAHEHRALARDYTHKFNAERRPCIHSRQHNISNGRFSSSSSLRWRHLFEARGKGEAHCTAILIVFRSRVSPGRRNTTKGVCFYASSENTRSQCRSC